MVSLKLIAVAVVLLCGSVGATKSEAESVEDTSKLIAEARSEPENSPAPEKTKPEVIIKPIYPAVHAFRPTGAYPQLHGVIHPGYPTVNPQLGVGVSSYQKPAADSVPSKDSEKKETPPAKPIKPSYYPKESSYATVPEQPKAEASNTARFVADPNRNQIIEEISENELQQLTMRQPHPFPMMHHHPQGAVPLPGFVMPGGPNPYIMAQNQHLDTATVSYPQTEHGFMDRVWGEVMTMREAITTDFFGAIPAFFRNIWDVIVGALSDASARMFGSFDFSSIDWFQAADFIARQLS